MMHILLLLLIPSIRAQCGGNGLCNACGNEATCNANTGADGCRWADTICVNAACDNSCENCLIPECASSTLNCEIQNVGGGEVCVLLSDSPTSNPTADPTEMPIADSTNAPETTADTTMAPEITTTLQTTDEAAETTTTTQDIMSSFSTFDSSESDSDSDVFDSMESTVMGGESDSDNSGSDDSWTGDSEPMEDEEESVEFLSTQMMQSTFDSSQSMVMDDGMDDEVADETVDDASVSKENESLDGLKSDSDDGTTLNDTENEDDERRIANMGGLDDETNAMAQQSYGRNESAKLVGLSVVASTCVFMVVALVIAVWCYYGKRQNYWTQHVEVKDSEDEAEEEEVVNEDETELVVVETQ